MGAVLPKKLPIAFAAPAAPAVSSLASDPSFSKGITSSSFLNGDDDTGESAEEEAAGEDAGVATAGATGGCRLLVCLLGGLMLCSNGCLAISAVADDGSSPRNSRSSVDDTVGSNLGS